MRTNTHDHPILAAALPRLTPYQRRAVEALAAGRPVASPLTEGDLFDMMDRLARDPFLRDRLERYYDLLDALAELCKDLPAAGAAVSRSTVEDALQGITPPRAGYAVCPCHGRERLPAGAILTVAARLPLQVLRHCQGGVSPREPVALFRHGGYCDMHHDFVDAQITLDGQEQLWRLFLSVPRAPARSETIMRVAEDHARIQGVPVRLGEPVALAIYRLVAAHRRPSGVAWERDEAQRALRDRLAAEFAAAPWDYPHLSASESEA